VIKFNVSLMVSKFNSCKKATENSRQRVHKLRCITQENLLTVKFSTPASTEDRLSNSLWESARSLNAGMMV